MGVELKNTTILYCYPLLVQQHIWPVPCVNHAYCVNTYCVHTRRHPSTAPYLRCCRVWYVVLWRIVWMYDMTYCVMYDMTYCVMYDIMHCVYYVWYDALQYMSDDDTIRYLKRVWYFSWFGGLTTCVILCNLDERG